MPPNKNSAVITFKASGKKEEVSLENILTEEEGKKKKLEKEKIHQAKPQQMLKRKHVATIFAK